MDLPEFDQITGWTAPCGCYFLIALAEPRVKIEGEGFVDLLEVHQYLYDIGERDSPPPTREPRIITRADAEEIARAKCEHPYWSANMNGAVGSQPETRRCARHAGLGDDMAGYLQVCRDAQES